MHIVDNERGRDYVQSLPIFGQAPGIGQPPLNSRTEAFFRRVK